MNQPSDIPRPGDESSERLAFVCALVVGIACIVLFHFVLNRYDFRDFWRIAALAIILSVIMVVFTVYVRRAGRSEGVGDRGGDNIYYLGLLYTLFALIAAILELAWHYDDLWRDNPTINRAAVVVQLLRRFALALWTTALGLCLRIYCQQFGDETFDGGEQRARAELAEATRSLKRELDSMLGDVNAFRRAVARSVEELKDELVQTMTKLMKDSTTAIGVSMGDMERTTGRLAEGVEAAAQGVVQRLEGVEIDSGVVTAQLDEVGKALNQVANRISSIDMGDTELAQSVRELNEALKQAAAGHLERAKAEREAAKGLDDLRQTLEGISNAQLGSKLDGAGQGIERMVVRISAVNERLESLGREVAEMQAVMTKAYSDNAEELGEAVKQTIEQADMAVRSTLLVQSGLLKVVDEVKSVVAGRGE